MISEETELQLTPEEQEQADAMAKEAMLAKQDALDDLGSRIESKLESRIANRVSKELEWVECARLYLGSLTGGGSPRSPDKPFKDSIAKRRPDVNIVSTKCDIAVSQLTDMQFATGERNWDMWPAANEVNEENADKAAAMALEIETQLDKCRYGYQSRLAITDRVIYGSGILKGPVNTGSICREYAEINPGVWAPNVTVTYRPEVLRVDPWFFYPDDSTNDFNQCEDSIEIHPMSAAKLSKYRKHDGFREDVITEVLKEGPKEYTNKNFSEYARMTDNVNPYLFKGKYCVVEYHGPITKTELELFEIEPTYDSPTEEYYGEVWVVNGKVIRIVLENIEASFEIPYSMSVYKKDPSCVFGFGMPLTMKDSQRVATQTWHMILDNASLSSGPQGAIQKRFIQPADGIWEIEPRKLWNLTDPMMKVQDAIQFFNVPNVTNELLPVLQLAREFAQEESATPLSSIALGTAQNTESATGQLITQQNSTALLDFAAEEWDDNVTQKVIARMYGWNMQYNPRPDIKGNYIIDVRSSTEAKNKQLHVRDMERLSMEVAQNPEMARRVKMDGLTKLRLEMMHIPNRTIIRTDDEVEAYDQKMAQQPNKDSMEMQAKMMEIDLDKQRLELDKMKLAFEAHQQQQREQWEHEEKMAANYARTVESQAMVLRAQTEKETELIKLAAHTQVEQEKLNIMKQISVQDNDTTLFLKSMEETRKAREALLTQQELKLKAKMGTGI